MKPNKCRSPFPLEISSSLYQNLQFYTTNKHYNYHNVSISQRLPNTTLNYTYIPFQIRLEMQKFYISHHKDKINFKVVAVEHRNVTSSSCWIWSRKLHLDQVSVFAMSMVSFGRAAMEELSKLLQELVLHPICTQSEKSVELCIPKSDQPLRIVQQ